MTHHPASSLSALLLGLALAGSVSAQPPLAAPADARRVALVDLSEPGPASGPASGPSIGAATATPVQAPTRPARHIDIDIGQATQSLLELQRNSPAVHARRIDGEQASRSYQRYLKSFETTIPEQYNTGLDLKKQ